MVMFYFLLHHDKLIVCGQGRDYKPREAEVVETVARFHRNKSYEILDMTKGGANHVQKNH